jgi:putative ABC transport system substrate-binding protein
MRRRQFITLTGGATIAALSGLPGRAQSGPMRRIGTLTGGGAFNDPEVQRRLNALKEGLQALGWVEARNFRFEHRSANDPERARWEASALADSAPDLIITSSGLGVRELKRATSTIPILFINVADPVGGGLISSLSSSGNNVTGFTAFEYNTSGKWLELLKEIAPRTKTVGVVFGGPEYGPTGEGFYRALTGIAPSFDVDLVPIRTRAPADVESALDTLAQMPNVGVIAAADAGSQGNRAIIYKVAARHRLPAVYPFRFYVAEGGLAAYGIDLEDQYRRAASYVDRILRGTHPKDLPVQAPNKFELIINLKTARAQGIDIPPILLTRADEVIE